MESWETDHKENVHVKKFKYSPFMTTFTFVSFSANIFKDAVYWAITTTNIAFLLLLTRWMAYTVKQVSSFLVPSRDVIYQTLVIPVQGEFGKWHPGWGRENPLTFFYSV